MKLQYVGPHDAVEVAGLGVVNHGDDVEVKGKLAEALLEQPSNWTRTDTPEKKKETAS